MLFPRLAQPYLAAHLTLTPRYQLQIYYWLWYVQYAIDSGAWSKAVCNDQCSQLYEVSGYSYYFTNVDGLMLGIKFDVPPLPPPLKTIERNEACGLCWNQWDKRDSEGPPFSCSGKELFNRYCSICGKSLLYPLVHRSLSICENVHRVCRICM